MGANLTDFVPKSEIGNVTSPPQPIDYAGFKLFMDSYLDAQIPEELCRHLFLSFMKKAALSVAAMSGKEFHVKDMAVMASQTICAPLSTELPFDPRGCCSYDPSRTEVIHGMADKFSLLGASGKSTEPSETSGRRSRAGDETGGTSSVGAARRVF